MTKKKPVIGIALGGGGARGLAHLGVLRALENAGIKPGVLAGTSMGAVTSVTYLQQKDFPGLNTRFREFVLRFGNQFESLDYLETERQSEHGLLRHALHALTGKLQMASFVARASVSDGAVLQSIVRHFLLPGNLEQLGVPVYLATLDSVSGQAVLLHNGDLRPAVTAAMSIPGYFPGVPLGNRLLHDAQAVFPVPIHAFRFHPVDLIVAVDVSLPISDGFRARTAIDLLFRQSDLNYHHIIGEIRNCSDLVIEPDVGGIHWTEFRKMDRIIQKGFEAGEKAVPQIKALLRRKRKPCPMTERPWHGGGHTGGREAIVLGGFPPTVEEEGK